MTDSAQEATFQLIRFKDKFAGTFIGTGNNIPLLGKKVAIGRSDRCDIILPDENVENKHATILLEEDHAVIVDLDSVAGTSVNGHRIAGRTTLHHMDQLIIGNTRFLFVNRNYPFDSEVLEVFYDDNLPDVKVDLEYKLKQETMIGLKAPGIGTPSYDMGYFGGEIMEILEDIVAGYKLPQILERIIDFMFRQFPADRGFIMLLDPRTQQLNPVATRSRVSDDKKSRLAISKTLLKRVWREREALLICDMGGVNPLEQTASMLFHGFTSILIAPLIFNNEFMGILQLDTIEHHKQLSEDDLKKMQAFCHIAALAIGNARMRAQLWEEERMRMELSRYLPRKMIDQMIQGETVIPPEGAQWELAVFFADIRGFSTMSGRLPSRDIMDILNAYYTEVSDVIFEHSGMINQFVGDEIMALFGGPWISDKDYNPCDAAVQASKDVIRQICRMNVERHEEGKETIFIGIGVDYGSVIIGNIGSTKKFEFTAISNKVVIANRLCSAAKESQILISDRVKDKLTKSFTMEQISPIKAKNVKDPIEAYRVYWNR